MIRILLCIFTFSILSSCNKIKSDKIESENAIIKKNEAKKDDGGGGREEEKEGEAKKSSRG